MKLYIYCIVFFTLAGLATISKAFSEYSFNNLCIATIGELDESYRKETRYFLTTYSVSYKFQYQGETFTGYQKISDEPLQLKTQVYFLPDDPNKNKVERESALYVSVMAGLMFLFSYMCVLARRKELDESKRE